MIFWFVCIWSLVYICNLPLSFFLSSPHFKRKGWWTDTKFCNKIWYQSLKGTLQVLTAYFSVFETHPTLPQRTTNLQLRGALHCRFFFVYLGGILRYFLENFIFLLSHYFWLAFIAGVSGKYFLTPGNGKGNWKSHSRFTGREREFANCYGKGREIWGL